MSVLAYNEILIKSWNDFVDLYERKKIMIKSEADIRSHLFCCCYKNLIESKSYPVMLFSEVTIKNKIADLMIGDKEIVIEIKYIRKGSSQTFGTLLKDVHKSSEYRNEYGVKHFFSAFVDETGSVRNRMKSQSDKFESWTEVIVTGKVITFGLVEII